MDDIVIRHLPKANSVRSKWDHGGKTQLVSALGKANIQYGTFGIPLEESGKNEFIDVERKCNELKQEKKTPVCF